MIATTRERNAIRRLMRERRRALAAEERAAASLSLCQQLLRLPRFRNARNVAAYLAVQGEMPLDPVIAAAWRAGKPVFLPRLRGNRLEFHRYTPATRLINNRFGIPEPAVGADSRINPRFLDLVLTPLVAFDDRGERLGTGGGFYDRTFAFLRNRVHWRRPTLLGIAYEFQHLPAVPAAGWDVPLHGVATDRGMRLFRS